MEVQSPSSLAAQLSIVTAEVAQELERLQEVEQQNLLLRASCERFAEAYDADPRWRIV